MGNDQLTHDNHTTKVVATEIILICDHLKGPANIGAIFRLCDAFQVSEIIFSGVAIDINSNRLKKTARNTQRMVRFRESENLAITLEKLHTASYTSIALEITAKSIDIKQFDTSKLHKIALIIGDENYGVSATVLEKVHHTLHIPMYGDNSSMNVAQATAIALYALRS
ncbi:TrmH family RNA methyltransferase [uncultured Dokdonia sp.]|uniref:TrmH family RNA methyltransferase n=1 Tax=uncultured Dokdonia sp. TaxID=575653 RepID=UPI002619AA7C|nr:TrmH family RNA methyltransferase [uncultured Dokdonia sp.]